MPPYKLIPKLPQRISFNMTSLMIRTTSIKASFGLVFQRAFSDSVVSVRARPMVSFSFLSSSWRVCLLALLLRHHYLPCFGIQSYADKLAVAIEALEDSSSYSSPNTVYTPNTPFTPATTILPPTPSSPKKRGAYPETRRPGSPPTAPPRPQLSA